jgi:hypothetical protein
MSIKSGQRYKFMNEENGLVLELYQLHRDDNFIYGSRFHGGENQQVTNFAQAIFAISIACRSYMATTMPSSGSQRSRMSANGLFDQSVASISDSRILPKTEHLSLALTDLSLGILRFYQIVRTMIIPELGMFYEVPHWR